MLNKSGYEIYADNVLVLMDLSSISALKNLKYGKEGELVAIDTNQGRCYETTSGLVIPLIALETETNCATEGYLVEIGEKAFEGLTKKPQLGQLVTFTRYAGRPIFGDDGKVYRRLGWKELNGGSTSRKL